MSKERMYSIITIVCFISIIFMPIGLVTMWFFTDWKKKIKYLLSVILTLLYIAIVAFMLLLEPSLNNKGVKLPAAFSQGNSDVESLTSENFIEKDNIEGDLTDKSDKISENQNQNEKLPSSIKRQHGKGKGRYIYSILFFFFMLFLIIWQNLKAEKKHKNYENPYVDTNQYKLPLKEDSKMPMVHFLKLRMNVGEKIYFATETIQKDNQGDFVVTSQRVVIFGKSGDYEFPMKALTAVSSVTSTVMQLTCGERKYYVFLPENQLKYALAVVRWAYSKQAD